MAAKRSKAEQVFRTIFPHTRITEEPSGIHGVKRVTVYAGDYFCADGLSRALAFARALMRVNLGYIMPDPDEKSRFRDEWEVATRKGDAQ